MPALVAGIHDFDTKQFFKSWMPDIKSGMTMVGVNIALPKNKAL